MENFFVYSLVLLFLVGFILFSVLILAVHSDQEERAPVSEHLSTPVSPEKRVIAHAVLVALFLFFLFLTLQSRKQYDHFQLDMRN